MKITQYRCDDPSHSFGSAGSDSPGQIVVTGLKVDGNTHSSIIEKHACNNPLHVGEVVLDVLYSDDVRYLRVGDIAMDREEGKS